MQFWSTLHAWHDHFTWWEACPIVSLHHRHLLLLCSSSLLPFSWISLSAQTRPCRKQFLRCVAHEIFFPSSLCWPPTDSERVSYASFTPTLQSVQIWFQTVQCLMFLLYLLLLVFKFIDLGGVGIGTWWSFWFSTFPFFYISDQVLKTDKNSDIIFEVRGRRWTGLQLLWGMASLLFIKV